MKQLPGLSKEDSEDAINDAALWSLENGVEFDHARVSTEANTIRAQNQKDRGRNLPANENLLTYNGAQEDETTRPFEADELDELLQSLLAEPEALTRKGRVRKKVFKAAKLMLQGMQPGEVRTITDLSIGFVRKIQKIAPQIRIAGGQSGIEAWRSASAVTRPRYNDQDGFADDINCFEHNDVTAQNESELRCRKPKRQGFYGGYQLRGFFNAEESHYLERLTPEQRKKIEAARGDCRRLENE